MKRSVKILFAVAIVLSSQFSVLSSAFAQFAGEDKKVAREPGNTQQVDIGTPDPANDICYMWTGPHIDGNANQAVITVKPIDTLEIYQVKRISKNGIEEDQVKVRVEDTISIVSVIPHYKCYNHGEGISTSQFDITTEPAGYERLVTVSPTTATNNAVINAESGYPLTFTLTHNGHTSTKVVRVTVYNSDLGAAEDIIVGGLKTIEYMLRHRTAMQYVWDNVERLSNIINSKTPKLSPCNWSLSTKPQQSSDGLSISPRMLCCSDHTSAPALKFQFGKMAYGNSFGCRFPFYGIPYVASADVVFNLSAEIFLGPANGFISMNKECNTICIPLGCTLAMNGGVGVSLGGGKLLSADLLVQGAWTTQLQWCPIGSNNTMKIDITFTFIGQVVTLGMIKHSIEYPFATYYTTVDLPNVFTN